MFCQKYNAESGKPLNKSSIGEYPRGSLMVRSLVIHLNHASAAAFVSHFQPLSNGSGGKLQ